MGLLILFLCLGILVVILGFVFIYFADFWNTITTVLSCILVVALAVSIVVGSCFGCYYGFSSGLHGLIDSYEIQKGMLEDSIDNDKLGGLERIEIIKQANELNDWLAKEKRYASRKTSFFYSKESKQRLFELEYIRFEKE